MTTKKKTVSAYNPFPFVSDRKKRNKGVDDLDKLRAKAVKNLKEPQKPQLSLKDRFLESQQGRLIDDGLKAGGWVRIIPRDRTYVVGYRDGAARKHKVYICNEIEFRIVEKLPNKSERVYGSWLEYRQNEIGKGEEKTI